MSTLEQLLRDAMQDHTSSVPPVGAGLAAAALRGSRRSRHLQTAAIGGTGFATAAVVAVTATLGGGAATVAGSPGGAAPATSAPAPAPTTTAAAAPLQLISPSPTTVTASSAPTAAPIDVVAEKGGHGPAALDAVTLPDPAPGFPLRRWTDAGSSPTGFGADAGDFWTKAFGVGVTPYSVSPDGSEKTPTGPEATVLVIDGAPKLSGTVTGHTQVDGQAAVFVDYDGEHGLGFAVGRFTVQVWGSSTVTHDQLVALAEALHGLPVG